MGRKRTPGLRKRNNIWHIEKRICGRSICESTGSSNLEEAELILARKIEAIRKESIFGIRKKRTFREAATFYLNTNKELRSIEDAATHLKQLDPFIGDLQLEQVHDGTLMAFIDARKKQGVKTKTINLGLEMARRVLNKCHKKWRDNDTGLSWLKERPTISLLDVEDEREPYPLSWEEQTTLFRLLPDHLHSMTLFKVNTGCRQEEVCGLKWEYECDIPELDTTVFIIPKKVVKNKEDRLIVLNRVSRSVIEAQRGKHSEYVFPYRGHRIGKINNSAWKRAVKSANLPVRVHDLKHTFGHRLSAAEVPFDIRKVLLGHKNGDITAHYSAPVVKALIKATNKVCQQQSGKTPALTVIKRKAA